jgi:hypothetical protein
LGETLARTWKRERERELSEERRREGEEKGREGKGRQGVQ